ncbi:hypothetical protein UPYG_G00266580 [Umbra pygmaea]|uniref:Uncharacterized protein n=1 Tax=Umbra pygmaea TaxID=75934 RepID=A0ABD0WA13_UMBPY
MRSLATCRKYGDAKCSSLSPSFHIIKQPKDSFPEVHCRLLCCWDLSEGGAGAGHIILPCGPSRLSGEMESSGESEEGRRDEEVDASEESRGQQTGCVLPADKEELDNSLVVGDVSGEKRDAAQGGWLVPLLPGMLEEDVPTSPHSCHLTQLQLSSTARGTGGPQQDMPQGQGDCDTVLPFNLDENFDYDNVVLSSKHPVSWPSA